MVVTKITVNPSWKIHGPAFIRAVLQVWRPVASDGHSVGAPVVLNVDV